MTGARGRLGRTLRPYLDAQGVQIVPFSREADAEFKSISSLVPRSADGDFDAVLHLAWSTVPVTAENAPDVGQDENLSFLTSYLDSAVAHLKGARRMPRMIFLSSCAVYGEPNKAGVVFDESHATAPIGRYAESKLAAEKMLDSYRSGGGDALVLRVTNPYGFLQRTETPQGVIPALVRCALSGQPFQLWGEGDAVKDYIYTEDFCCAVHAALEAPAGIFNIASGQSVALSDAIAIVEELTGRSVSIVRHPAHRWDVKKGRYSSQAFQKATQWVPRIEFREGLQRFVAEVAAAERAPEVLR